MIIAGVDIVDIERFKNVMERRPGLLTRLFTFQELEYCHLRKNPYPSLAVRFAAKEAVKKMHPGLQMGVSFQDIEVFNDSRGKPYIILRGKALQKAQALNMSSVVLSLSHSQLQAVAMAVAEKEDER